MIYYSYKIIIQIKKEILGKMVTITTRWNGLVGPKKLGHGVISEISTLSIKSKTSAMPWLAIYLSNVCLDFERKIIEFQMNLGKKFFQNIKKKKARFSKVIVLYNFYDCYNLKVPNWNTIYTGGIYKYNIYKPLKTIWGKNYVFTRPE